LNIRPIILENISELDIIIVKTTLVIPFQDSKLFHNFSKSKSKIDDFLISSSSSFIIAKTFFLSVSLQTSLEKLTPFLISCSKADCSLLFSSNSASNFEFLFRISSRMALLLVRLQSAFSSAIPFLKALSSSQFFCTLLKVLSIISNLCLFFKLIAVSLARARLVEALASARADSACCLNIASFAGSTLNSFLTVRKLASTPRAKAHFPASLFNSGDIPDIL